MNDQQPANGAVPDSREADDGFWARERLVFFSDAVIAIALTLLALDLPVPKGETNGQVWHAFVDLLPHEYLSFMISFLVIARFWRSHHVFFTEVTRVPYSGADGHSASPTGQRTAVTRDTRPMRSNLRLPCCSPSLQPRPLKQRGLALLKALDLWSQIKAPASLLSE